MTSEQFGTTPPYHPEMNTISMSDLLRLSAEEQTRPPAEGPCLSEAELAAVAEGTSRLPTATAHIEQCPRCCRAVAGIVALLADPSVAEAIRAARAPTHRQLSVRYGGIVGLVAAVVLVVVLRRPADRVRPDPIRDAAVTATAAPSPISPQGLVNGAAVFTWSQVEGASSYRVTVFDSAGAVIAELQVGDTTVAMPDSVLLPRGRTYFWRAEARTGWNRWSTSPLVEFRIVSEVGTTGPVPGDGTPLLAASAMLLHRERARLAAEQLSGTAANLAARTNSIDVPGAFRVALADAAVGDPAQQQLHLRIAQRLAESFQAKWGDDFLLREFSRFVGWSPAQRLAKVKSDGVRGAGVRRYGRGGPAAAIAVWQQALAQAAALYDSTGMAAAMGNIGAAMARQDRADSSLRYLTRAQELADLMGDARVSANAISEIAGLRERTGDMAGARQLYDRAIALHSRIGDSRGLAADYNNAAALSRAAGDLDDARRHLEAALAINRRGGRPTATATNLVNLGSLAASDGHFARANDDYREALGLWTAAGDSAEAASALLGLGELALRRGDYPGATGHYTAAAALYARTGPVTDELSASQGRVAALAGQGKLQAAIDELRHARELENRYHVAAQVRAATALAEADLAVRLNQYPQAERLYGMAATLFGRDGLRTGVAAAQHGLGMLQLAQGNAARAYASLDDALRTQLAAGDGRSAATTRIGLAELAARSGDHARARRLLDQAVADLERLGDPVAIATALTQRGDIELDAGDALAAESWYRLARTRLGSRDIADVTWRIYAGQARALRLRGRADAAAEAFRAAIGAIERLGGSLYLPDRRSELYEDKWAVYVELAALEHDRGRVGESFAISEALRGREMAELLALGRVAAPRDTSSQLVTLEQDLRRQIGELTRNASAMPRQTQALRGPDVNAAGTASRSTLLAAQARYTGVQREIRERAPRYDALVAPAAVSWRSIARQLEPGEVLLEYLVSDSGTLAYVVTRDSIVAVTLQATHRELARRIEFARGRLLQRGLAGTGWRVPLRQLYRDLIEPIAATGLLSGKSRLTIVPHAELHYLPFAALIDGDGLASRYLVQRYVITVVPSAAVWLALGARPRDRHGSGVLAMAPRPRELPATVREVATATETGGEVLSGGAATESEFRRLAPTQRVIHLATYGVLNKQNPLFSYVDLAGDGKHDGLLEVHEVFGLALSADLVVLSACQTGLAAGAVTDVPAGDDWVGLTRAFLTAGAANVAASLWPVQDGATATLMTHFYARYPRTGNPASALAGAQRAMLATPETADPYLWAGFQVIGRR